MGTSEGTGTSETSRSVVRILNLLGIKFFFLFSLRLSNFINRLYSLILTLRAIWSAIHISLDAIGAHGGTEAVLRSFAELATFRSEVVRVGEIRTAKSVFWLFTELASFNSEGVCISETWTAVTSKVGTMIGMQVAQMVWLKIEILRCTSMIASLLLEVRQWVV